MADANAITLPLDHGGATDIDPTLLRPGYLQEAEGAVYVAGDPAIHKIGGRTRFDTAAPAAADVNGINFVGFDNGTDYVTAQINGTLYAASSLSGIMGSIRTGLTASASMIDRTKFADAAYFCNGVNGNWVYKNDNTTFPWGLQPVTGVPVTSLGGTGLTGTFIYWFTEYDSVNAIESANDNGYVSVTPANQTVTVFRPPVVNSTATHWRLYRTIAGGSYLTGWRVTEQFISTSSYADSTSDATLVLNAAYDIVSINDIPESQDFPPPIFRSVATFEGSLCGVADRSLYFSETSTPHYFPRSYAINFRPTFGGQARCVKNVNKVLLVFFDSDCFRVNTLPKAADSFFNSGEVQEHIASYGTPSPLGACTFSGWGGSKMVFLASRNGPMLTDGNAFDSAVSNIAWQELIPPANLATCVALDNPDEFRVELYYEDAQGAWRRLDFYYDGTRIEQARGFPELAWTGPHLVPGPGTFGVVNSTGTVWTGSRSGDGKVYKEDQGNSDAANLADSNGTINFRIRTGRVYANGINSQGQVGRVFISKAAAGLGTYAVTLSTWNEGDREEPTVSTRQIDATTIGATSDDFNRSGQSFDIRITRDDAVAMPPINNITAVLRNVGEYAKVNRR